MQTWIHIQDGKHILDSCRDYSDGDWNPKNNCVEYGLYNEFAQENFKLLDIKSDLFNRSYLIGLDHVINRIWSTDYLNFHSI